jgi:hypothetical protein
MNLNDLFNEEKVRLDPKCWTGKKIGNPKTKMKGGVRVNNCVPAESVAEGPLDEVSQDTARSYAQKARVSQKDLINQTHRKGTDTDKLNKKIQNRQQGLNRAHTDKRYYKDEPGVAEGEQQKGADYRDPKEVDYDDEYDAMVARVKKLAGLGPMRTVYDPAKRQYRNMPTAVQPKK